MRFNDYGRPLTGKSRFQDAKESFDFRALVAVNLLPLDLCSGKWEVAVGQKARQSRLWINAALSNLFSLLLISIRLDREKEKRSNDSRSDVFEIQYFLRLRSVRPLRDSVDERETIVFNASSGRTNIKEERITRKIIL